MLYKKLNEYVLTSSNKIKTGEYYFDYIPTKSGKVYYEWYGEIAGKPSIKRDVLTAQFIQGYIISSRILTSLKTHHTKQIKRDIR